MESISYSHKISDGLYLVNVVHWVGEAKLIKDPETTHHIVVVDCSGSMSGELPRIREQLKAKLPKILQHDDTITLIWFSGRGQFGTLVEAESVQKLTDLQAINKAIDRWLSPIGLTGFKEPLQEVGKVIDRVAAKLPGVFSLFFMSDGCDNQWSRADIEKAVGDISSKCSAATFVEYGFYADRQLLARMAERAGGTHIFADKFAKYEPIFEASIQKEVFGGPKVEVEIAGDPISGFVYDLQGNDLLTFSIAMSAGKMTVTVPENTTMISYLSNTMIGIEVASVEQAMEASKVYSKEESVFINSNTVSRAYAALSLFAVRMKPELIYPILKSLGDVAFIEQFAACFGKQRYSDFMEQTKKATFDVNARLTEGWDPNRVPPDDAFCVLELLELLTSDEETRIIFDHPDWDYNLIGRVAVQNPGQLNFNAKPALEGYPISSLTLNEERPNISILVRKEGTVDLTGTTIPTFAKNLPLQFPSFIFRNYTIVRDGIINVDKLVVQVSDKMMDDLWDVQHSNPNFFLATPKSVSKTQKHLVVIDLSKLPIINRKMVKAVSAQTLFDLEWRLTQSRAEQKVYNTYRKEMFPKESKGYKLVYGEQTAQWLADQGITDFNGFSPKTTDAEATDFYMGKQLDVKLKGYSSLPSVKEVETKISTGKKLTGGAALMEPTIMEVKKFLGDASKPKIKEDYLEGMQKAVVAKTRASLFQKAQQVFSVIVGQVWFKEFPTLNENTLSIDTHVGPVQASVEMKEIEIKI